MLAELLMILDLGYPVRLFLARRFAFRRLVTSAWLFGEHETGPLD
jgi:hypothetical protein